MTEYLKQKVQLYNPNGVTLPRRVRESIAELDGQSMSLEEAVDCLTPAVAQVNGEVRVIEKGSFLALSCKENGRFYRLIHYKGAK